MSAVGKGVIVSLDLMLALPIASVAFLLLFSSIKSSQSYLASSANSEGRSLEALVVSQQIANKLDSSALNYSGAVGIAANISAAHGFGVRILSLGSGYSCGSLLTICRLVTLSGSVYVLLVYNESPD